MKLLQGRLTYANVMATIAVFVALGGVSYAATQLPKNSVGAKQLKQNAVTAAKIKNGTVTSAKLDSSSTAALTGARGPQGQTGPPGSAKAWAEVSSDGKVVRSFGNVTAFQQKDAGWYCIDAGANTISNSIAVANLNFSDEKTGSDHQILVTTGTKYNDCPDGQFQILTAAIQSSEGESQGFVVAIL